MSPQLTINIRGLIELTGQNMKTRVIYPCRAQTVR